MNELSEIYPEHKFPEFEIERNIEEAKKTVAQESLENPEGKTEKEEFLSSIKDVVKRAEKRKRELIKDRSKEAKEKLRGINIKDTEWINTGRKFILEHKENPEKIRQFWENYKLAFGKDTESWRTYKTGILTGLAVKKILEEELNMDFSFSDPETDVDYKIDGWGTPKEDKNTLFAVQIKGRSWANLECDQQKRLISDSMVMIFNRTEIYTENQKDDKEIKRFKKGVRLFLKDNKDNKNFMAMFVTLPTGQERKNGPKKFINDYGEPTEKVRELFKKQFEEKMAFK